MRQQGIFALACAAAVAAGCSSGGGGTGFTIKGHAFKPQDTISNVITLSGSSSKAGMVLITNGSGVCSAATASKRPKNLSTLMLMLQTVNADGSSSPISAPGTYSISLGGSPGSSYAYAVFTATDADCNAISDQGAGAVSGSVKLDAATGGVYSGSFDLTMDSGDHLTGSFSASGCAGLSTGGSNSCG
jgi:hypothetical protein